MSAAGSCVTLPFVGCIEGDDDGWPMHAYDAGNTGYNPRATGPRDLELSWSYGVSAESRGSLDTSRHGTDPSVIDGFAYFGSNSVGELYAVDAEDGEEAWVSDDVGPLSAPPAVAGGLLYAVSEYERVYALDARDGKMVWDFEMEYTPRLNPVVDAGVVFVGGGESMYVSVPVEVGGADETVEELREREGPEGAMYAIDVESGDELWSSRAGSFTCNPAVSGDLVFSGTGEGTVYALDAGTGEEEWSFEAGASVGECATVSEGLVFVGTGDGDFYALDSGTGEEEWSFEAGDSAPVSAAADGIVYVTVSRDTWALDADTGEELWSRPVGGEVSVARGGVYLSGTVEREDAVGGVAVLQGVEPDEGERFAGLEDFAISLGRPVLAEGAVFLGGGTVMASYSGEDD